MKKGTNLGVPLSSTPPSVQHISSTQKGHFLLAPKSLSSTPKIPQFQTKKPLSSTSKTPQFYTPLNFTPKTGGGVFVYLFEVFDVELRGFRCGTEGVSVLNWGVFGVELRGLCWTEGFLVWNWGILGAEKELPFCVELMCWTEGDVELRRTPK